VGLKPSSVNPAQVKFLETWGRVNRSGAGYGELGGGRGESIVLVPLKEGGGLRAEGNAGAEEGNPAYP